MPSTSPKHHTHESAAGSVALELMMMHHHHPPPPHPLLPQGRACCPIPPPSGARPSSVPSMNRPAAHHWADGDEEVIDHIQDGHLCGDGLNAADLDLASSCRLIATVAASGTHTAGLSPTDAVTVLGGKASCRRKFVVHVQLVDPQGLLVPRDDISVAASVAFAHDRSPVGPDTNHNNHHPPPAAAAGEPPLFTTFNGVEFPAHDNPTRLLSGRATFKLALSLLSSKFDNRLFSICFTPQWHDATEYRDAGKKLCEPCFSSPIRSISRKRAASAMNTAGAPMRPFSPPPLSTSRHPHVNHRYLSPPPLIVDTSPPRVIATQLSPDHSSNDDLHDHNHHHNNNSNGPRGSTPAHQSKHRLIFSPSRSTGSLGFNPYAEHQQQQHKSMFHMQQQRQQQQHPSRLTLSPMESCSPRTYDSASESSCTIDHHHRHHKFQYKNICSSNLGINPALHHHPTTYTDNLTNRMMCSSCNMDAQINRQRPLSAPSLAISGGSASRPLIRPQASIGVCRLPFIGTCNNHAINNVNFNQSLQADHRHHHGEVEAMLTTTDNVNVGTSGNLLGVAQQAGGSMVRHLGSSKAWSSTDEKSWKEVLPESSLQGMAHCGTGTKDGSITWRSGGGGGGKMRPDRESAVARIEVEEQERAIRYLELTLYEVSREIQKRKEEMREKRQRLVANMSGVVGADEEEEDEEIEDEEEEEEEEEEEAAEEEEGVGHNFAFQSSSWINTLTTTTKLTN